MVTREAVKFGWCHSTIRRRGPILAFLQTLNEVPSALAQMQKKKQWPLPDQAGLSGIYSLQCNHFNHSPHSSSSHNNDSRHLIPPAALSANQKDHGCIDRTEKRKETFLHHHRPTVHPFKIPWAMATMSHHPEGLNCNVRCRMNLRAEEGQI